MTFLVAGVPSDKLAFGYFYGHRAEGLIGSTKDPKDPDFVAKICYTSAIVYAAFVVFCGLQVGVIVLLLDMNLHIRVCQSAAAPNLAVHCYHVAVSPLRQVAAYPAVSPTLHHV